MQGPDYHRLSVSKCAARENRSPTGCQTAVNFKLLAPHEAPAGKVRAREFVAGYLHDERFTRARVAVAFARKAGVVRIIQAVDEFRARGGRAEAIIGIDHRGTSEEALRLLLDRFDAVSVLYEPNPSVTFHPKLYLFDGATEAQALVGSHNLTLGGLELNYEAGVAFEFSLPAESEQWSQFDVAWSAMLPSASPSAAALDTELIDELVSAGLVEPERAIQARSRVERGEHGGTEEREAQLPFRTSGIAPPSAIPAHTNKGFLRTHESAASGFSAIASVLLIEVVPRPNSEVFLSARAIDQNPGFFGWPWSGQTTPKVAGNKPYPKMDPHPTVRFVAFDSTGKVAEKTTIRPEIMKYHNADVRMTVGQELRQYIPPYSLLLIRHADEGLEQGTNYEMEVHPEGSPGYRKWITRCDQTLPSGGKPRARRMGWV